METPFRPVEAYHTDSRVNRGYATQSFRALFGHSWAPRKTSHFDKRDANGSNKINRSVRSGRVGAWAEPVFRGILKGVPGRMAWTGCVSSNFELYEL